MSDRISVEELRETVRAFAEREFAPKAEADRPRRRVPSMALAAARRARGARARPFPRRTGGAGLGFLEHLVVVEEISRASASIGMSYAAHSNLCVHNLWANGTPAQRARWLPRLLAGEHVGALAMSEADAGSDVIGSMSCRAERVDGGWVANGSKMWITNGPEADVLIAYMRTTPDQELEHRSRRSWSRRTWRGSASRPKMDKLGMRGSPTAEIVFSDCEIPDDHLLGEAHRGVRVLMSGLDSERLVLSGGPIGIMQAALDLVLPYVRERRQFGKPIGSFELMQGKLADMFVALESSRALRVRGRRPVRSRS